MGWWQFSLNCQASELEQVEDLMLGLGALSITLSDAGDEPIYEPLPGENPVWQESIVAATFDGTDDHEHLYQQLTSELPDHLASGIRLTSCRTRTGTRPTNSISIRCNVHRTSGSCPAGSEPPDPDATIIRLDPGLAFGTGGHPTTALCLAWLGTRDLQG